MSRDVALFGTPVEERYGFAQAVRAGDTVYVSGQTAFASDGVTAPGDMRAQMRAAYDGVARALAVFGGGLGHVVDETLFVTDMPAAVAVAADVRRDAYGGRPAVASTLIGVAALGSPDLLVEIKCVARL